MESHSVKLVELVFLVECYVSANAGICLALLIFVVVIRWKKATEEQAREVNRLVEDIIGTDCVATIAC
jgi:hypothetical protein